MCCEIQGSPAPVQLLRILEVPTCHQTFKMIQVEGDQGLRKHRLPRAGEKGMAVGTSVQKELAQSCFLGLRAVIGLSYSVSR
jgi:hypothetical protein